MLAEGSHDGGKFTEILLSRDEYHTRKSTVELKLHEKDKHDNEYWKPFRNTTLKQVSIRIDSL